MTVNPFANLQTNKAGGFGTGAILNNGRLIFDGRLFTGSTLSPTHGAISGSGIIDYWLTSATSLYGISPPNGCLAAFTGTILIGVRYGGGAKVSLNSAIPAGASMIIGKGSTYYNAGGTISCPIQLNGGNTNETLGQLRLSSTTIAGDVTIAAQVTGAGNGLIGSTSANGVITGAIQEINGPQNLTVALCGGSTAVTITLTGANTYSGSTIVYGGCLVFGLTASCYGGDTAKWTAANLIATANGAGIGFRVGGAGEFTASDITTLLTNLGGLGGAVNNNGLMASGAIGFDTTNSGGSFTVADNIANSTGTGGGAVGILKYGSGLLYLTGVCTQTGSVLIRGGSLILSGGDGTNGTIGVTTSSSVGVYSTTILQLQSNATNTVGGLCTAMTKSTTNVPLLTFVNSGGTVQLRSNAATTFYMGSGFGGLTGLASTTFYVNNMTTGTGFAMTVPVTSVNHSNNNTINITGGNSCYLIFPNYFSCNGTAGTLTLNPTTAGLTFGGFRSNQPLAATLILGGTATTNCTCTGAIQNSTGTGTPATSVQKTGAGTWSLAGNGSGTFTGGLLIKAGELRAGSGSAVLGGATNPVTLGDTTGSSAAILYFYNSGSGGAQPITVVSGSSGLATIQGGASSGTPSHSGTITLQKALTIGYLAGGTGSLTLTGGITGTGNITLSNLSTTTGVVTLSTGAINMTGSITNSSASGGTSGITISAGIGTNVTGVTQSSATCPLILSGTNTYTGGTSVTAGVLIVTGSIAAGSSVSISGGTVRGTGTVAGTITVANVANSTLRAGNSSGTGGTLTTGPITFSGANARISIGIASTTACGLIASSGAVVLGGATLNFDAVALNAGTYTVMTASSMSGTVVKGTLPTGRSWTSLSIVGNNLVAVLA